MEDLISRQAAIDVIDKIFPVDPMRNEYTQGITCGAALAKEWIKSMPSAEPKKGRWIAYKGVQIPERHGLHYCSNCHHSLHLASNGRVYNYCPRCGAKMEASE